MYKSSYIVHLVIAPAKCCLHSQWVCDPKMNVLLRVVVCIRVMQMYLGIYDVLGCVYITRGSRVSLLCSTRAEAYLTRELNNLVERGKIQLKQLAADT